MRRLILLPTLVAALLVALIALPGGRDGSAVPASPRLSLLASRGRAGPVRPLRDMLAMEPTTTTTTVPPTTTTTVTPPTTTAAVPPPPAPAPAAFVCPVQGAASFVDSFGAARSGGRTHQGVDMMAASGTPTVAPASGRVEHRGSSLGGLSWWVHADDGTTYYGTHLSGYANEGAGWVQAGTVIGYVGDTGNAAGTPHLHFEMHPGGGAAVDPYPQVATSC
jgi:murein DD-endopeptidase MepM/ murein hydrolase activator NlpD